VGLTAAGRRSRSFPEPPDPAIPRQAAWLAGSAFPLVSGRV
jgi:hypothetical protein